MRYAIFCTIILSLQLLGVSVSAAAMRTNGIAIVKAISSRDVIEVGGGCGAKRWPNKKTGKCDPFPNG
jgi:hypothetical protein